MNATLLSLYVVPMLLIWAWYLLRRRRREAGHRAVQEEAVAAGLIEPASLHPAINPAQCVGCGSCVRACPEQPEHTVLGLIGGKAQLVSPTDCIGHGACRDACPVGAITLVFGTATRGVDIPVLRANFESNVPGIYVAGELGGMGLIRNALVQGREAAQAIAASGRRQAGRLDVLIVGAGPAGFAAALTAQSLGLRYLVIEQESLGGCVYQYPRGKLVMTSPVELPLVGKVHFRHTSKEELLRFWTAARDAHRVPIRCQERVDSIDRFDSGFIVRTSRNRYPASNVLLAIGRRGTPRKLGVPGEDLPKVVYRLIDPEQYRGQKVLVVGGGDSALEAAASIAEVGDTHVTLSYRGAAFTRAKQRNRERVDRAREAGTLDLLLSSQVSEIHPDLVVLEHSGLPVKLGNQAVIVNAGGVLPNEFLRGVGVQVETKYGTA